MFNLTEREKNLLKILIAIASVALIYFAVITPLLNFRKSSNEQLEINQKKLETLDRLYHEYRQIRENQQKYEALLKNKNDNITVLVEQWANSAGVSQHMTYSNSPQKPIQNKYMKITTNIKLNGVPIQNFLRFLYEIESSNTLLKISFLRIYQGLKTSDTYDIQLNIDTFSVK